MRHRRGRRRQVLLDHEPERIAGLGQDLLGANRTSPSSPSETSDEHALEQTGGRGLPGPHSNGPGRNGRSSLASALAGVRIDLPDPDHGIVDADQLALDVPLEHADLSLVGGPHAVIRAEPAGSAARRE